MRTTTKFLASVLAVSAVSMTPAVSRAECGMGDVDWYSPERELVSRADALLDGGQPAEAAKLVQAMWPHMMEARPVAGSLPHIAEAVRVMALACVRAGGRVPEKSGWRSATPADRAANVSWGVSRLRMLVKASPDNTLAKSDLGEALSRSPATAGEAADILESLAVSHAIGTAEAYAALAGLRRAHGDVDGADMAFAECASVFMFDHCASTATASAAPTATADAAGTGPIAALGR